MSMNILDLNTCKKEKARRKDGSKRHIEFREILGLTSEGFRSVKIGYGMARCLCIVALIFCVGNVQPMCEQLKLGMIPGRGLIMNKSDTAAQVNPMATTLGHLEQLELPWGSLCHWELPPGQGGGFVSFIPFSCDHRMR